MQEYGKFFAYVYNHHWNYFASAYAPCILDYYKTKKIGKKNHQVLDLCCGTGQLARTFLAQGYEVIGIDKSKYMLDYAKENTKIYEEKTVFYKKNAVSFNIDERVGLVTCLFDSLNHFTKHEELESCFHSVYTCLDKGGYFIFDLNTRKGLERWACSSIQNDPDVTIINQGIFTPEMEKAYTQVTGFIKNRNGTYTKFSEVFFNTHFLIDEVVTILKKTGFSKVSLRDGSFTGETDDPEEEQRIFFVCVKK